MPAPVIFFTCAEYGQSNSILAVATELKLRSIPVHIASDNRLKARIESINASFNSQQGPPITFHFIDQPPQEQNVLRRGADGRYIRRHAPAARYCYEIIADAMANVAGPKYIEVFERCREILGQIDNVGMAVCDVTHPASQEACEMSGVPFVARSCTAASDLLKILLPRAAGFWYYPWVGTGFPFPLTSSPLLLLYNIFVVLRHIFIMLRHPLLRDLDKHRHKHGLHGKLPYFDLFAHHPKRIFFGGVPEIDYPLQYSHQDVVSVGPMMPPRLPLDGAQSSTVTTELSQWLNRAPTIVMALGSHFEYEESDIIPLAKAFRAILLRYQKHQLLWKVPEMEKFTELFDEAFGPLGDWKERIKITDWIHMSMIDVLEKETVVVSVHHGGANSYFEPMSAGVPQIILPQWVDLYDNAVRAEWLHVGVYGNRSTAPYFNSPDFEASLDKLLNDNTKDRYIQRAKECMEACKRGGGRVKYADILLDIVAQLQK